MPAPQISDEYRNIGGAMRKERFDHRPRDAATWREPSEAKRKNHSHKLAYAHENSRARACDSSVPDGQTRRGETCVLARKSAVFRANRARMHQRCDARTRCAEGAIESAQMCTFPAIVEIHIRRIRIGCFVQEPCESGTRLPGAGHAWYHGRRIRSSLCGNGISMP